MLKSQCLNRKKNVLSCSTGIRYATFGPLNFCSESLTMQLSQTLKRLIEWQTPVTILSAKYLWIRKFSLQTWEKYCFFLLWNKYGFSLLLHKPCILMLTFVFADRTEFSSTNSISVNKHDKGRKYTSESFHIHSNKIMKSNFSLGRQLFSSASSNTIADGSNKLNSMVPFHAQVK
jgi:hypothetical protein